MPNDRLIAVVDDDASFLAGLVDLLTSAGYRARGFASAEELLSAYAPDSYSCIITDIHMDGVSGIDLARRLEFLGYQRPIIMVTGRADARLESLTAASGAVCLLKKPFACEALIGAVERALNDH